MMIANLLFNSLLLFISLSIASNIPKKKLSKEFQNFQISNSDQSIYSSSLGLVSSSLSSSSISTSSSLSSKKEKPFQSPFELNRYYEEKKENEGKMKPDALSSFLSFDDSQVQIVQVAQFMKNEYAFNPSRQMEIIKVLSDFPMPIIKIISGYDWYNGFLIEYYNKVMDALKVSDEMRRGLNFHDEKFAIKFEKILIPKKDEFEQLNPFWAYLARLFFKWMIYMREKIVNHSEFKKVLKELEPITFIIQSKAKFIFPSIFNLKLKSSKNDIALKAFLDCELTENINFAYLFDSMHKYFYGGIQRGMNVKTPSEELEKNYFGGRFNNNFILKLMILFYDHMGKMRDCIPFIEKAMLVNFDVRNVFAFLPDNFIRENVDKSEKVISFIPNLLNKPMMKYILKNNFRFMIAHPCDVFILLKKFKELKILTKELCEKHIGFGNRSGQVVWNLEMFQQFLYFSRVVTSESGANVPECNEFLNLF